MNEMEEFNDQEFRDKLRMAMNRYKESIKNQQSLGEVWPGDSMCVHRFESLCEKLPTYCEGRPGGDPLFHLY